MPRFHGAFSARPVASAGNVVAALALLVLATSAAACAHRFAPPPSGPAQRFQGEAAKLSQIRYEDEFLEGRLLLQALPADSPERPRLRERLVSYLLGPVARLEAQRLKREARELDNDDLYDRIYETLRDAAGLFEPRELWAQPLAISQGERELLGRAARLTLAIFSPRGAEPQVALSLAILVVIEPGEKQWADRFDQLLAWTEEAGSASEGAPFRRSTTSIDLLQSVLGDWPAPAVADRLAALYGTRQQRFSSVLKRPLSKQDDPRRALSELLAQGEEMQRPVAALAVLYLRCARLDRALQSTAPLAGRPGDDPELRSMLAAADRSSATASDFLKLARRFLPRIEILGGTAPDTPDPVAAFRVLEIGIARLGADPEMLVLSAQLAKLLSAPFLAVRQLEEAQQVLERAGNRPELLARVSTDLLDLYFLRLRLALDPERGAPPPEDEVARLRQRSAETRKRFSGTEVRIKDAQIDFELARSFVNAGLVDRAEPMFLRAQGEDPEPNAEITAELAALVIKRGEPQRALKILKDGLEALRNSAKQQETIGGVEGRARLEKLLGDAHDLLGDRTAAELAWRSAAMSWERLMVEYLRRKIFNRSAEAMFEMGRLLYLLGRRPEGIQKFEEAIEQDGDRDQSYIDAISFLVQHGEVDAALGLYRRALAKPDRSVSEYVKVYASLWVRDLTSRVNKAPDPTADAFLRTLELRHPEIRPQRGSAWYRRLAAHATGRLGFAQLQAAADTPGKQAEVYFYRAMALLSEGKTDEAHRLLQQVVKTNMVSFFEYEMASRYLRAGAPNAPPSDTRPSVETI